MFFVIQKTVKIFTNIPVYVYCLLDVIDCKIIINIEHKCQMVSCDTRNMSYLAKQVDIK